MKKILFLLPCYVLLTTGYSSSAHAQEEVSVVADAGESRSALVGRALSFDITKSTLPPDTPLQEANWNFGDGSREVGEKVSHVYARPGTYTVTVRLQTDSDSAEDVTEVQVFSQAAIVIADDSAPIEQLTLQQQQAARAGLLLVVIRTQGGGPEALTEEELSRSLLDVRDVLPRTNLVLTWTSGGVGANVLSKFAQHIHQASDLPAADLNLEEKGVIMLSETPFTVLTPTAQSAFDQLQPSYILLTRPTALALLTKPLSAEEARSAIFASPIEHRLLGTFSARTVRDIGVTNFMSFGLNFLVNHGVPVNNITLILMLPVIATILSFSRQVIGIKAFGLITPAMTALSFLVLGLKYGLLVFAAVLLAGTLTRLAVRRLHLLYLPRMALVLTSVSIAILLLLGIGLASNNTNVLSFSIFPTLILMLLAEEFIAVQFTSGAKRAATTTAWTLLLAIACYFIVSWELLRTLVLSYPEITLLAIPLNIAIGRFTGLRLTEYIRFRKLLWTS